MMERIGHPKGAGRLRRCLAKSVAKSLLPLKPLKSRTQEYPVAAQLWTQYFRYQGHDKENSNAYPICSCPVSQKRLEEVALITTACLLGVQSLCVFNSVLAWSLTHGSFANAR